jgi:hypothetical protein
VTSVELLVRLTQPVRIVHDQRVWFHAIEQQAAPEIVVVERRVRAHEDRVDIVQ